MKTIKLLSLSILASLAFTACSDDDEASEIVNEEEVITTLTATLVPGNSTDTITLKTQDLDGDGPNDPVVTVSGNLAADTTYEGTIVLLNETESPAENITEEVEEESDEHQFFYAISSGLNATTTYTNFDSNGENLGTEFTLTTGAASSGNITFILRHEPKKPNTGSEDAGGETDISATFSVVIE
ncbi:hypothetical protein CLV91_0290 [Maribacter vaceletii]|uniref:Type 1 periplasmic binding fold superfamily protein n=1 Tax=Maribacter vaceletii TaxID=1206816 RepID=A0A495EBF6_9FLAO|nr:type 1 periplasmic binding fold superfamily protein [Maribacter vaceletii]RKR14215.1 hypothetical protein CLV91_0290 [Maribacter vaceletii]